MFLCHALSIIDRIFFHCFGMSCFVCIVLPFVDIYLVSLLLPEPSGLFPHVVLLFFSRVVFSLLIPQIPGFSILPFWSVFVDFFLSGFPVELPILVLTVFFVVFEETSIFLHTNFNPA